MKLLEFPIVRITIWFVLGILMGFYLQLKASISIGLLVFSVAFFLYGYFKSNNNINNNSKIFAISLYSLFFSIGVFTNLIHTDSTFKNHYSHYASYFEKQNQFQLIIDDKLRPSKNNKRYIAHILSINNRKVSGSILLNIKNINLNDFTSGTLLKINTHLSHHFKATNPNQFDYASYLETKNIFAQVFASPSEIKISSIPNKNLLYYTSKFRNTIIQNLTKKGLKNEELSVLMALILGQQQDISPEVMKEYQYAGAIHILSVSGLHIGFILMFITYLLKPLPNNKWGTTFKLLISIACLWLFALVAGMAPSVVRSATMFSFVALGMYLNRPSNIYHTIVVSLFLILLFEPHFLFDVGFQLSYMALFFIVWLQPLLKQIWSPKYKLVSYFWDIITVSFAAQLGTLPLSIYYFHQFPGLFFVTNLVLIPFVMFIMGLGLLIVILAYFNSLTVFLVQLTEKSIWFMNYFIKQIASLENFIIKGIPLNFGLLVIAYGIIYSWIFLIKKPSFIKAVFALTSVLALQIHLLYNRYEVQSKKEFIVFNAKKNNIITFRNGQNLAVFSSDPLHENDFNYKMIQNYAVANFLKIKTIQSSRNVFYFKGKKILIVDDAYPLHSLMNPDIIIINDSPKLNLDRLLLTFKPYLIIANSSNYKSYISKWKTTCEAMNIPFHNIYEQGFYKLE